MLIIVEAVGFVGRAPRWIDLGFIRLQPSEFMKPAIVIVLARFYECFRRRHSQMARDLARRGVIGALGADPIQPDLGTATCCFLRSRGDVHRRRAASVFLIPAGVLGAAIPIVYHSCTDISARGSTSPEPESDPLGQAITSPSRK